MVDEPRSWFFTAPVPAVGEAAQLSRDEAKHATGARRLAPGDRVVLFDGAGTVAVARLGSERRRDGGLDATVESIRSEPRPTPEIVLATAIPKGDRLATLVDMTAQLGLSELLPLDCERSVVRSDSLKPERVERIQVEACKQARRAWLPRLAPARTPGAAAEEARARGMPALIAHPTGAPIREALASAASGAAGVVFLVGPEGGFTDDERGRCRAAGAVDVSLGTGILRVETACVAMLAQARLAVG